MKISSIMAAGILLLVLSSVADGLILAVPFLSFSIATKAVIISVLLICGNVLWWVGVPLVGKEILAKYRKYLNPRSWTFLRKKTGKGDTSDSQSACLEKSVTAPTAETGGRVTRIAD